MGLKRGETFVSVNVLSKDGPKKGGNFVSVNVLSKDGPKKGGDLCGSKRVVPRNIVWKRLQVLQFI